jgi:uncharacterized phage protein (TIGR01671 family)
MREILFRGKENPSGEWIEGFLVGNCHIGDWVSCSPIHSKTVGQYTGLTDKNGKKIFEGDIVKGRHFTSYKNKKPEEYHLWVVDWSERSGLIVFNNSPTTDFRLSIHDFADFGEVEIIGNIHDNKELLGEQQ